MALSVLPDTYDMLLKLKNEPVNEFFHEKHQVFMTGISSEVDKIQAIGLISKKLDAWSDTEHGRFCYDHCLQLKLTSMLNYATYEKIVVIHGWFEPEHFSMFALRFGADELIYVN